MTQEELQEALLQAQEHAKELEAKLTAELDKNKELTEQNNKLVDYNNKLFMRVTTEPQPQQVEEKPLTAEEAEEKEIAEIKKLMEERRIY